MNANMIESEMLTSTLEREMRKLINKARMEVLEVCSKEYNFDINAAMLLVNAGGAKDKVAKERKAPIAKEKVVKEPKTPTASGIAKEKKERAKKAVKEFVEGSKRNSKGRPKNPEKVVDVEETENLFEQLVNTQLEQTIEIDDAMCCVVFQTKEEKKTEESGEKLERGLMSGEEKATKTLNKAESKLEASANAIAAKEQAKLAKDAEKLAAKEYKLLCQQKKAEEKLAAASAIAEEKLAKAQEKKASASSKKPTASSAIAAKVQEKKASTSSKKPNAAKGRTVEETSIAIEKESTDVEYQANMTELSEKVEAAAVIPVEVVSVMATASSKEPTASGIAPATLKVKSFKFEGVTYFREKTTGAIYDKETNDHLGQWNEATQKIDFLEPEEELEEEEESDGESSDEEEEEEEEEESA
jgi:hypothetical protein